jgi:hypothetical protein
MIRVWTFLLTLKASNERFVEKIWGQKFDSSSGKEKVTPWSNFFRFLLNFPLPVGSEAIRYASHINFTVPSFFLDP